MIGSIRVALRAGSKLAAQITSSRSTDTLARVGISVADTPNKSERISRVTAIASASPIANQVPARLNPWCSTNRKTSARLAPSAIRIPISLARCVTE